MLRVNAIYVDDSNSNGKNAASEQMDGDGKQQLGHYTRITPRQSVFINSFVQLLHFSLYSKMI